MKRVIKATKVTLAQQEPKVTRANKASKARRATKVKRVIKATKVTPAQQEPKVNVVQMVKTEQTARTVLLLPKGPTRLKRIPSLCRLNTLMVNLQAM